MSVAPDRAHGLSAEPPSDPYIWRRRLGFGSLRARIFAVNIFAVIVLGLGIAYLDTVRERLLDGRAGELARQAVTVAAFAGALGGDNAQVRGIIEHRSFARGTHLRLFAPDGSLVADNWRPVGSTRFVLVDPSTTSWRRRSARMIDGIIEDLGAVKPLPPLIEPVIDRRSAWPEAEAALATGKATTELRRAPDGEVVLTAASAVTGGAVVHLTEDAADVTQILRRERQVSFQLLLGVTALTLFLSIYLARTIVRPLRMLAVAAHRVRLGRSREVIVPRLPERRDEIGALARALSDMSIALRQRIDATEAFAADIAHELKNPLASLRSAVDTLEQVQQPALRHRLLAVIRDDVGRLDRLITDIADASRLDAELSRSRFEPVDATGLAAGLVAAYEIAGLPPGLAISFATSGDGGTTVQGDPTRLAQVLRNLIDNAVSFSPNPGTVRVSALRHDDKVTLRVEDEGPGVPAENRGDVFKRFYSQRPEAEDFGRHSGLGLSIAGAIVEAHGGSIRVGDRPHGAGAAFTVELPAA